MDLEGADFGVYIRKIKVAFGGLRSRMLPLLIKGLGMKRAVRKAASFSGRGMGRPFLCFPCGTAFDCL